MVHKGHTVRFLGAETSLSCCLQSPVNFDTIVGEYRDFMRSAGILSRTAANAQANVYWSDSWASRTNYTCSKEGLRTRFSMINGVEARYLWVLSLTRRPDLDVYQVLAER
jgi:hypothetical protein